MHHVLVGRQCGVDRHADMYYLTVSNFLIKILSILFVILIQFRYFLLEHNIMWIEKKSLLQSTKHQTGKHFTT